MDETLATYDRIAPWFADTHWETRLADQMSAFLARLPSPPSGPILDAGCGPGRDCAWFAELGHGAVGVDASPGMLGEARRRVPGGRFLLGDLRHLPIATGTMGGVWMCASLLHLRKAEAGAALAEARRGVPLGAPLYVGVQFGRDEGWRDDDRGRRWFSRWEEGELAEAVTAAGFEVNATAVAEGSRGVSWLTVHAVARP